jgi:hypothetical protein
LRFFKQGTAALYVTLQAPERPSRACIANRLIAFGRFKFSMACDSARERCGFAAELRPRELLSLATQWCTTKGARRCPFRTAAFWKAGLNHSPRSKRSFRLAQAWQISKTEPARMAAHSFRSSLLRGWRAQVRGEHPNLPIIALTNHRPVSLDLGRTKVLAFNSRTPSSGRPHLIASRTYNVRGILIGFAECGPSGDPAAKAQ